MSPWIKTDDGIVAHINVGSKFRFVEFLCDGDVGNPKAENGDGACDKGACPACMRGMGHGQHLCPDCVTAGVKCVPVPVRCAEVIGGGGRTCYLPKKATLECTSIECGR